MSCFKCKSGEIVHRFRVDGEEKGICNPCIDEISQIVPKHVGDVPDLTPLSIE